jgi:hypothetical protein
LSITVTLRPICELYQVRDVFDSGNSYPYIQPDYNKQEFQMYRFLQTPPSVYMSPDQYINKTPTWNADVHLLSTYCFLSKEESQLFAAEDQIYLVKDVYEYKFLNIVGSKKLKLEASNGMISSWMWYLQRNDVNMRNEWSNYTNWPYRSLPANISQASTQAPSKLTSNTDLQIGPNLPTGPGSQPDHSSTGYFITGPYSIENRCEILETMGILLDGDYRENILTRGVYDYIEKYVRTEGSANEGLYCYNFCLNTSPFEYQPSGAINLSRFKKIELELTTYVPQFDATGASFTVICDDTGNVAGIASKPTWQLYQYSYNMTLFEERYNILSFIGGNCGMLYAR